jgi:hypothetical protein
LSFRLAVGVIEKDFLAGIPPTGHMINRTGKLQSVDWNAYSRRTCWNRHCGCVISPRREILPSETMY